MLTVALLMMLGGPVGTVAASEDTVQWADAVYEVQAMMPVKDTAPVDITEEDAQ